MSLTVPDCGEIYLLEYIIGLASPTSPVMHLYNNNVTIGESTTLAAFTEDAEAGYAAITLTTANWTLTQAAGTTTAVYSQQTFSFTTNANVYGYYVTDTSNHLLWCEQFTGAPFNLPVGGGTIAISPRVTLD